MLSAAHYTPCEKLSPICSNGSELFGPVSSASAEPLLSLANLFMSTTVSSCGAHAASVLVQPKVTAYNMCGRRVYREH